MSVSPIDAWRRPGCSSACYPGRHDPGAHEGHGFLLALLAKNAPAAIVRTGPLLVDLGLRGATVDGAPVVLAKGQWAVLASLAGRLDAYVSHDDLAVAITGSSWYAPHAVRQMILRLRQKLGSAAGLIETRPGGFRLLAIPPSMPAPVFAHGTNVIPVDRWAKGHDACVCCGTTARRHRQHGRCIGCRRHVRHQQGGTCPLLLKGAAS